MGQTKSGDFNHSIYQSQLVKSVVQQDNFQTHENSFPDRKNTNRDSNVLSIDLLSIIQASIHYFSPQKG